MDECIDNEIIADIQRCARLRNTNILSFEEYIESGGKYSEKMTDCEELGFANLCTLAGVKVKI